MEATALPKKFLEEMQELLGPDYEDFLKSYAKPMNYGLRVNTLKITASKYLALCGQSLRPVPWNENGFYYDGSQQYSKNPLYHAGLYYIQEPSAMRPAQLLPVEEGDRVLDLCAAPGGKSTALGAKLNGTGLLVSNDVSASRAKALLKNIEFFGIKNSLVLSEQPSRLAEVFSEYFDKVLIDAPCSGEGMFRKKPSMIANWEAYGPAYFGAIQREILKNGADMLKPGGFLVYSTCTFSAYEDEESVQDLLSQRPEMECLVTERLWPHEVDAEGHFCCLLHKKISVSSETLPGNIVGASAEALPDKRTGTSSGMLSGKKMSASSETLSQKKTGASPRQVPGKKRGSLDASLLDGRPKKPRPVPEEFEAFLLDAGVEVSFDAHRLVLQKNSLYYFPEDMPDFTGLRVIRNGWYLGELKKNRFEPSGAFARALKKEDCRHAADLKLEDDRVIRYLKGETIPVFLSDMAGGGCGRLPEDGESLNASENRPPEDAKSPDDIENRPQEDMDPPDGWYLICVCGYPLGFGKLHRGMLKNKYPAGWRWA